MGRLTFRSRILFLVLVSGLLGSIYKVTRIALNMPTSIMPDGNGKSESRQLSKERYLLGSTLNYSDPSHWLVRTERCWIPAYVVNNPARDSEIQGIPIRTMLPNTETEVLKPLNPNLLSWTTSNGAILNLKINDSTKQRCCYRKLNGLNVNSYGRIRALNMSRKCTPLLPNKGASIHTQHSVVVNCHHGAPGSNPNPNQRVYQYLHRNVPVLRKLKKFWETFKKTSKTAIPSSVFVIGIDRLSNTVLQSQLPKSFKLLQKDFAQFKGYTSLGNRSPMTNLIPLLTGKSYEYWLRNCRQKEEDMPKDAANCRMDVLWKYFRSLKYETLLGEKLAWKPNPNQFIYESLQRNYLIPIKSSPGIHTLGLFQLAQLFSQHRTKLYVNKAQTVFDFGTNFHSKFTSKSIPTFSFLWLKGITLNFDECLSDALGKLLNSNNTFIILASGRGEGSLDSDVLEGKLDQMLPVLYMRLPPIIDQSFKDFLATNSERLTTPFDLHETLKSILNLGVNAYVGSGINGIGKELGSLEKSQLDWVKVHGVSLISQEVSRKRSCSQAGVPKDSCPCSGDLALSPSKSWLTSRVMAEFGLEQFNSLLNEDSEFLALCSQWEFGSLLSVLKLNDTSKDVEVVLLNFTASPGPTNFGLQCTFKMSSRSVSCDISTFTRLSPPNPHESYCIERSSLFHTAFCYCNEL